MKRFVVYAKLPEMRLFWFILILFIFLFAFDALYLAPIPLTINGVSLLLILGVIFFSNLRLARTNLEIKVERNELGSIVDNLRDGIVAYDPDFRILIVNRAAEAIFGVTREALLGTRLTPERLKETNLTLLIQIIFPSLAPLAIRRSETGAYPQIMDFSFKDSRELELQVTTDKIIDPRGTLLGFVKIIDDRTRESGLIQAKTEFIGIAAHQLRTPLTAVNWALEVLKAENPAEKQKELIDTAYETSAKMLKIVNDLLDVSKIEEGRFGYEFKKADIVPFIENSLAELAGAAKQAGVNLYFEKPEKPLPTVVIDLNRLRMALLNLIDNALRYNVPGGSVTVSARELADRPYIEISVKDTGIGIPPEEIKKLFAKFVRASNASAASPDGSGLGLYIVRNIIRKHGGDVWVKSELNRGSAFYFTLPTDPKLAPQG